MAGLDVAAATERCIARLAELGLTGWSERLLDAVRSTFTSGELLMAIRWHLRELDRVEQLPDDVRQLIRETVHAIDQTGV